MNIIKTFGLLEIKPCPEDIGKTLMEEWQSNRGMRDE
jgi:hypothetical protein